MIWDCAYAELYFSDSYWPDFGVNELHEAIKDWNSRVRRFGGSVNVKTMEISEKADALIQERPRFNNQHVQDSPDGRRVVFQLWDWAEDAGSYRNSQFLIRAGENGYELKSFETELRALKKEEMLATR